MAGTSARRWSQGTVVLGSWLLLRCAQGENLGIDQPPTYQPPEATGAVSAGGTSSSGGADGAGTSSSGASGGTSGASTGGGGTGGSESTGGGSGASGTGGSAGTSDAGTSGAGGDGLGGASSEGGAGGEGGSGDSGIVGGMPYGGTPWAVPGTIQAEDYDLGGATVAYSDTTPENFGTSYRTGDGVDIEACTDTGAGFNVGWNVMGEWREYTVKASSARMYTLSLRVASPNSGATVQVDIDDADVTGLLSVPNTGAFQAWQTVTKTGIALSKGIHVIRVNIPSSVEFNINWLSLT
jgi:hypothetical protein